MLLNLIIALAMIYLANITRTIEKDNDELVLKINKINKSIHINKIELTIHKNNDYIKKLHRIYYSDYKKNENLNLISVNSLSKKNNFFYLVKKNKEN